MKKEENKMIKNLDAAFDFNLSSMARLIYLTLYSLLFLFAYIGFMEKAITGYFEYIVFFAIMLFTFHKADILASQKDGLIAISKIMVFVYLFLYVILDIHTNLLSASLISATNSLPKTPDKTVGFYRRWLIVDFPNQFEAINKDLIADIPEVEFNNLAKKVLRILKELYQKQKFTNEGSFEERQNRYEERSNPLQKFIEVCCDEDINNKIELRNFSNAFNDYAKINHLRTLTVRQVGKMLRDDGFEIAKRKIKHDEGELNSTFILNLGLKTTETTETTEKSKSFLRKESLLMSGSSGSSGSFFDDNELNITYGKV